MLRFVADEDFNGRIVRGLQHRRSDLDIVRAQDVGLQGSKDDVILEWANEHQRMLLTHDARTIPRHVQDRLSNGLHVSGVFIVDDQAAIGTCIEDLILVAMCSGPEDWHDQVYYLPFR